MSKIDDGGPAYPQIKSSLMRDHRREPDRFTHDYEMTESTSLRDHFAGQSSIAMSDAYILWVSISRFNGGPYRNSLMTDGLKTTEARASFFQWWAQLRYEYADAMIGARKAGAE